MKRLAILASLLFLAAACAPAEGIQPPAATPAPPPAETPEPAPPQSPASPTPAPTETGVNPGVAFDPGAPVPEGGADAPIPDLSWDPSGGAPLITGTFCCGFTSPEYIRNYIPEFQIWGDGRYLWVVHDDDGSRSILESRLSEDQLGSILRRAGADGFFGWQGRYANDSVADYADKCIRIRLLRSEKQVCEYYAGAPAAFHQLFADLATGFKQEGRSYFPTRGFLQLSVFDVDFVTPNLVWEDPALKLSRISSKGAWISGAALTTLWEALNRQPWGPVAVEDGVFYIYTIRIEGISLQPPPTP